MAHILAAGVTRFGRIAGSTSLGLMASAARQALAAAGVERTAVDALVTGYSTTQTHIMFGNVFAEYLGLRPAQVRALQLGGATGGAMVAQAARWVDAGLANHVLVVAGENRLTGQSRDASIATLAQVGEREFELPYGASVPAYYALLARRYQHEFGAAEADLAELAVLMRRHAARHPLAHLREPLSVAQVLASKPIAEPLKFGDCCPISDGAVALLVGRGAGVRIAGCGEAHQHQHVSWMSPAGDTGAATAAAAALHEAGWRRADLELALVYDSFSITLAILLEELGLAPRGQAGACARGGEFELDGRLPLNPHGGLLSFGHSGVAGGLAHVAEAYLQLSGQAGARQVAARRALVHGDGGVLSSHVTLLLCS
jgi:acetyl-CoA acetyltransferase